MTRIALIEQLGKIAANPVPGLPKPIAPLAPKPPAAPAAAPAAAAKPFSFVPPNMTAEDSFRQGSQLYAPQQAVPQQVKAPFYQANQGPSALPQYQYQGRMPGPWDQPGTLEAPGALEQGRNTFNNASGWGNMGFFAGEAAKGVGTGAANAYRWLKDMPKPPVSPPPIPGSFGSLLGKGWGALGKTLGSPVVGAAGANLDYTDPNMSRDNAIALGVPSALYQAGAYSNMFNGGSNALTRGFNLANKGVGRFGLPAWLALDNAKTIVNDIHEGQQMSPRDRNYAGDAMSSGAQARLERFSRENAQTWNPTHAWGQAVSHPVSTIQAPFADSMESVTNLLKAKRNQAYSDQQATNSFNQDYARRQESNPSPFDKIFRRNVVKDEDHSDVWSDAGLFPTPTKIQLQDTFSGKSTDNSGLPAWAQVANTNNAARPYLDPSMGPQMSSWVAQNLDHVKALAQPNDPTSVRNLYMVEHPAIQQQQQGFEDRRRLEDMAQRVGRYAATGHDPAGDAGITNTAPSNAFEQLMAKRKQDFLPSASEDYKAYLNQASFKPSRMNPLFQQFNPADLDKFKEYNGVSYGQPSRSDIPIMDRGRGEWREDNTQPPALDARTKPVLDQVMKPWDQLSPKMQTLLQRNGFNAETHAELLQHYQASQGNIYAPSASSSQ